MRLALLGVLFAALLPSQARADFSYEEPLRTVVGFDARLALLRGEAARLSPEAGFGFGVYARRRIYEYGAASFWTGADLGHDRFTDSVTVRVMDASGRPVSYQDGQQLSHTTFVALQAMRLQRGRLSGHAAAGAGVSISYFNRPSDGASPLASASTVAPVVRAAAGFGFDATRQTAVYLQFTYNWLFSDERIAAGRPFGDTMNVALGIAYHF